MNTTEPQTTIDAAWERRAEINPESDGDVRDAVHAALGALDRGELRVAEWTSDRAETNALYQIPIIDRVPGTSNVLVGCGWTGHGWAIAPAVAPHLAHWALDGSAPDALKPFSLGRFPV